jgi:hypothetical protein
MVIDIILIAIVGAIAGLASIPFGFTLTSSVYVVFIGNAFGSAFPRCHRKRPVCHSIEGRYENL